MKPQKFPRRKNAPRLLALALFLAFPSLSNAAATIVDIATDATDPSNLADTEPSIAVNPANPLEIAVVSFSEGWSAANPGPVWRSSNGGVTWTKVRQLPPPNPSSGGPGDQKIAFDASGKLYVVELALGVASPRLFVYRQTGTSTAALTAGTVFGSTNDDQPHLDVDRSSTSAFLGRLYSPWLDFSQSPERSTVSNSTNNGASLTNVAAGNNTTFANRTTRMAIGPNGRAYIIYKRREGTAGAPAGFENAHFTVNRSDNGGVNWSALGANGVSVHGAGTVQTFMTTSFGNPAKGKVARARSSDAWIAVDPGDGDVYATYVSRDTSGFGQIFVARSTNGGTSWTSARVTDGTHHCAFPEIAVAANGAIGVLFIDFDDAGPATLFRHHFARSFNDGATWSDQILQSMDPGPIGNASSGFLWGDYEGVTAVGNTFYGVFTGASIGRTTSQLDPIFFQETAGTTPVAGSGWVTAWGANRLDIFGLGTNSAMYHKAWNGSSWQPSISGWENLGGTFVLRPPAVTAWGTNRLDVFGIGTNNGMYHKAWNGSSWQPSLTGWEYLGGIFTSPPTVVAWGNNRLDVFGIGTDKGMYHKAWNGSSWQPSVTGWEYLGGVFSSPPAAVAWGSNRLDIFGLGTDNAMYHKAWNGSSWQPSVSGWENLGGTFSSPPAVAAWGNNRLDIFGLGTNSGMYHKAWNGSSWQPSVTGWEYLGGVFSSPPAVAAWGSNRLDVFGLGTDSAMYHKAWNGSSWQPSVTGWENLGGVFISPPNVSAWGTNRLDVFGLGTDSAMYHKAWNGSSWQPSVTGWESLGGVFIAP